MRLMTLNTHSLAEANPEQQLHGFVSGLLSLQPDVIALQEVNQSLAAPPADPSWLTDYVPVQRSIPVRADNFAANAVRLLREAGIPCAWTYLPMKCGYDRYDEGLALLALHQRLAHVEAHCISRTDSYQDWRTRWMLCARLEGLPDWFYSVHMGWWQDAQEPFQSQWQRLSAVASSHARQAPVWLMGDFNAPAHIRGESYDCIQQDGWHDTFCLARHQDDGTTVPGAIDGWRGERQPSDGMRIDMIWCSQSRDILSSHTVFRGEDHPMISDHFGVLVQTASDHVHSRRAPVHDAE